MQAHLNPSSLNFEVLLSESNYCSLLIKVPSNLVTALYKQAVLSQKNAIPAFGFHKRETPAAYIEQNFEVDLVDHIKEFLLKYLVLPFLYQEIIDKKILIAGQPRLHSIILEPGKDAFYQFELSLFPPINFQEWKYLPFKAPKRKNYKDLDRQVETFLQEELTAKQHYSHVHVNIGDWVNYKIILINSDSHPVFDGYTANLWIKIGDEEADKPFQELFLQKKVEEEFISTNPILQDYFSDPLSAQYKFIITIVDVIPFSYFCFDQFKHHFRLKSNKEMYQKLIEVFSYRNDLSLRRTMVEEALKLLFSKHRFEIPNHLILRQQQSVLDAIQFNPDYHVYRVQKDFKDAVKELAEKQTREEIFLDQLAYEQNIELNPNDLRSYLNLTKRPRTKEFLHFDPPFTKMKGQEYPLLYEELKKVCLREKTLNHIIYHLTRK